ncbi:MAG: hypothetical protein K6G15_00235 [Desulfovibrio sp.]|nr:hypothetical protein [Desulfovibrio sp.]
MRTVFLSSLVFCLCFAVSACASKSENQPSEVVMSSEAGGADIFNPWRNAKLPQSRHLSKDGDTILGAMGGREQSIKSEAAHRPHWREEIYPVIFGSTGAAHEILVLLDFSEPASQKIMAEVTKAASSLNPNEAKIVVFGKSRELYGTDLTGLMIWISYARKGQALPYLNFALKRWNEVKAAQKAKGRVKTFTHEFDSTAKTTDYPIHYTYLQRLTPPVPESDELKLAKYSYDAGNINMFQTTQVMNYFGIGKLPCVLVDGKILSAVNASSILAALR